METEKLLLLSLGTGNRTDNRDGESSIPYKTAVYRYGDNESIKSPFVAEPIIKEADPDEVVIIGTVKSAWGAFYYTYHKKESENFIRIWDELEDKELKLNKDSSDTEIDAFQTRLNEIFSRELDIHNNPKVQVCLIKYGLNDEELRYNYTKIKDCLTNTINGIDKSNPLDVSFDITHSFRSLPLYNLAIIEYCRLIFLERDIKIGHVFYGNLDVSRENNGIAQIVDLREIVGLLTTSRGISEFIDTGNANTLLKEYKGSDEFFNLLNDFNGAIHMNARAKMLTALRGMLDYSVPNENTPLLDAEKTVQEILKKSIPQSDLAGMSPREKQVEISKFQINLSKWLLENGQVGLASAIAKEALRSYLVSVYEEDVSKYEKVNVRVNTESRFESVAERLEETDSVFRDYNSIEPQARIIRNVYAHNLESADGQEITEEQETGETQQITYDYEECYDIIKRYVGVIEKIMELDNSLMIINDNIQLTTNEEEKISLFISFRDFSGNTAIPNVIRTDLKKRRVLQIKPIFDFSYSNRMDKMKQIRNFAKELVIFIDEILNIQQKEYKIIWDEDIDDDLTINVSELIRSQFKEKNINYEKLADNGDQQEKVLLGCWSIDLTSELKDQEKNRLRQNIAERYQIIDLTEITN